MRIVIERPMARGLIWFAAIALIALPGLMGCAAAQVQEPMIEVNLDRPEGNSIQVVHSSGRAFIDVCDSGGINGLNARLTESQWPEQIVVLLRLQGLERLEIQYRNITIATMDLAPIWT